MQEVSGSIPLGSTNAKPDNSGFLANRRTASSDHLVGVKHKRQVSGEHIPITIPESGGDRADAGFAELFAFDDYFIVPAWGLEQVVLQRVAKTTMRGDVSALVAGVVGMIIRASPFAVGGVVACLLCTE